MILREIKRDAILVLEVDPQLQKIDVIGVADRIEKPSIVNAGMAWVPNTFANQEWRLQNFCWIRPQKVITREVHDFLIPTTALDDCVDDCPRCKQGLTCQSNQIIFAHVRHGVIGSVSGDGREMNVRLTNESSIIVVSRRDRRGLVTLDMRADERLAIGLKRLLTGEIMHFTRVLKPEGEDNGRNPRD